MQFAKRMGNLQAGVFSSLAVAGARRLAEGKQVIDFSVGAPNIPPAPHVREELSRRAAETGNYIYALRDLPALTLAAARWYERRFSVSLDPETQVTALLGSQEGLSHFCLTVADPGDIVLVPEPCYPAYAVSPILAGAKTVYMPVTPEQDWLIDLEAIPQAVARAAKLMIVSYPGNPTTALAPPVFYERLIKFAREYEIIVLHDNAYSELVFDGATTGSFLQYPGALDVGVEFNSLSKTYGLAGSRIGFALGNTEIIGQLKLLKSNIDFGVFLPVQYAAIAALEGPQDCVAQNRQAYEHRRDVLREVFAPLGWAMPKSPATMFVWAKIPPGYTSSEKFAGALLERAGMLVIPGTAFGAAGEGYVRIALVRSEAEIIAAGESVAASGLLKNIY
jgi:LL-diaminopimelate aminotransferase